MSNDEKISIFEERTVISNGRKFNRYSITPYGAVINKDTRHVLKSREMKNSHGSYLQGYQLIDIYDDDSIKHSMLKHRLVAETYIPNPDNLPTVNHKDGDKSKNDYTNLEWMSFRDNNIHAIDNGLTHRAICESHQNASLSNDEVRHICELLEKGCLYEEIISELHLEHIKNIKSKIKMIKTGNAWSEISKEYTIPQTPNRAYVDNYNLVHRICRYLEEYGFDSYGTIMNEFDLDKNETTRRFLYGIRTKKKYKSITTQYNF